MYAVRNGKAAGLGQLTLLFAAACAAAPNKAPVPQPPVEPQTQPEPAPSELVAVPGGTFMMGGGEYTREPAHQETVVSFEIGRTEVTTAQYRKIGGWWRTTESSRAHCAG